MAGVIVTGATGFIGSHVVERFAIEGYSVLGIDKRESGQILVDHPSVTYEHTDILDLNFGLLLEEHKPIYIIHLAAWSNVRESMREPIVLYANNVMGTANIVQGILNYLRANGGVTDPPIRSLVFASSSAADNPESHYGVSKRTGEDMLRVFEKQTGIRCALLRFGNVYGPRQNPANGTLIASLIECLFNHERPTIYGDGNQKRDYIYVADIANAIAWATGNAISCLTDVATGVHTPVNRVLDMTKQIANSMGLRLPPPIYTDARPGDKADVSSTVESILQIPKTPLQYGIRAQIAWAMHMKGRWEESHYANGEIVGKVVDVA